MAGKPVSPFATGVEVAVVHRWMGHVTYRPSRVEKVLESGRFTLEGIPEQWRPEQIGPVSDPKWLGFPTSGIHHASRVEFVTKGLLDEAAAQQRREDFASLSAQIAQSRAGRWATDAHVATLRRLLADLESDRNSEAAPNYDVGVFWSDEDGGFVAIPPDLPGCSAVGSTRVEAVDNVEAAIRAWIEAATSAGNTVPPPSRVRKNGATVVEDAAQQEGASVPTIGAAGISCR